MSKPRPWYSIQAAAQTRAQVYIFGVVVDYKWDEEDTSAKDFIDAIKSLGDFDLRINSPGGSVAAGTAIYNALRRHKGQVDVYVEGIAASIASVIAMAGNRLIMPSNTMLMIHDPWSYAVGTADDMRKAAEMLDKFKSGLVDAYQDKTGMDRDQIAALMADETWMTAAEAVEMGFADQTEEPLQAAARFDLTRYRNAPRNLAAILPPPSAGAKPQGVKTMNLDTLQKDHPDLLAQIQADARQGLLAQAEADTARAEAVSAERERILALVNAAVGEQAGAKIATAVQAGLSADQLQALGVNLAPQAAADIDEQTRAQILAAITGTAPAAVAGSAPQGGEQAERAAAAQAIAAGANAR